MQGSGACAQVPGDRFATPFRSDEARVALRQELRQRRRSLPQLARLAVGAAVAYHLDSLHCFRRASAVVAYVADDGEVPTLPIVERLWDRGIALFLPALCANPSFLRYRPGDQLGRRSGWCGPVGGEAFAATGPTAFLLPLVAWNCDGWRLGRGSGYYDRALAQRPLGSSLIGLAYEFQSVSHSNSEPWDVSLDYVVTERRVVRCGSPLSVAEAESKVPCLSISQ